MFLILFSLLAQANDAALSAAASALDRGQPKIAIQLLEKQLLTNPTDADLNLLAGTAHTRIGRYREALEFFNYSSGSRGHNNKYSEFHADTLRMHGRGREAAELRMGLFLVGEMPEGANIRLFTAMIDDYRSVGALDKAYGIHALMEAQFPNGILTQLMGAELALDQGNVEEAFSYLALIDLNMSFWRIHAVRARLAYLEHSYEEAYQFSFRLGRTRQPTMGVNIRLQSARMSNDPMETIHVLGRMTWEGHEAPEFLLSQMLAYADIGQFTEAIEYGAYLSALYPDNALYIEAVSQVEAQISALNGDD